MEMTDSSPPQIFVADTISGAWIDAFLYLLGQPGGVSMAPLQVQVTGLRTGDDIAQDVEVRQALDKLLVGGGRSKCETVANTIFPSKAWNREAPRGLLFERFIRMWPSIRRHPANRRGTYFQRMIAYGAEPKGDLSDGINQLEHMISTWEGGNHRKSALEAPIVDPRRDHTHSRRLGFPCLHQVSFVPLGTNGADGLRVAAFYPTQYYVEKAYGNFLGLARLGQFVAHEMGLELRDIVCSVSKAGLPASGAWTKKKLLAFADRLPERNQGASSEPILGDGAEVALPGTAPPVISSHITEND